MNVKAPSGLDWRPLQILGKDSARLKSNEWKHVLTSGILKFCIRGLLAKTRKVQLQSYVMSYHCYVQKKFYTRTWMAWSIGFTEHYPLWSENFQHQYMPSHFIFCTVCPTIRSCVRILDVSNGKIQ